MAHSEAESTDIRGQHPLWDERNASGRRAMLTEILAQVSHEALQGDTLESVLQAIVDCATRRLPVTIASIILLNDDGTHFVQEVWSGRLDLQLPGDLPWPVTLGVAGGGGGPGPPPRRAGVATRPRRFWGGARAPAGPPPYRRKSEAGLRPGGRLEAGAPIDT